MNKFLTEKNLQQFIKSLNISKEQKNALLSGVSEMGKGERIKLLDVLKEIYLLDLEEKEALKRIKDNWILNPE